MTFQSGPINITQGNSANFVIEFLDANGDLTVPSSAELYIVYTTTANVSTTESVTLTLTNSFYTGTWSSTGAALGLASWVTLSAASATPQGTGQLRIIDTDG